jgi:AcrR family transcriptional regulator
MAKQPKPGRHRVNDPEGLRRRVLDAAAQLFQARGYANASLHEVGQAAGVTGGALHHHFPSKRALGLAVIRERVRTAVSETWIEPVVNAASLPEGVSRVFQEIEDGLSAAGRVNGCPLNNLALELSSAEPELREEIEAVFSDWRGAIADRIRRDQSQGQLKGFAADALAMLIVAAYSGAMTMAKAEQRPDPLAQCRRQLIEVLAA